MEGGRESEELREGRYDVERSVEDCLKKKNSFNYSFAMAQQLLTKLKNP